MNLMRRAILNALGTGAYVFIVSQLIRNGERIFGNKVDNNPLGPMMFLMLFLFSALLTGFLVLGKPIMLYIDGKKKEALTLLFYTGASLFILMLIVFTVILAG